MNPFEGYRVPVKIPGQHMSPHHRELVRKALQGGDTNAALRFRCLIAEATNEALGGAEDLIDIGGRDYCLNPKSKSQFGKDQAGVAFLTTGLIDLKEGTRYRLTWTGTDIPHIMKELAVAHDEGRNVAGRTVMLSLSTASVHVLGEKNGKKNDPRRNHDTAPNGKPYVRRPRRHHSRICADDL